MLRAVILIVASLSLTAPAAAAQAPPRRVTKEAAGRFSLDTPIVKLLADPRAKAAVAKTMPTLARSPHLDKVQHLSMRELAANPHAVIAAAKLRALEAELRKIK